MKRIIYKDATGKRCIGYARSELDGGYIWVVDSPNDSYGFTIPRHAIIAF